MENSIVWILYQPRCSHCCQISSAVMAVMVPPGQLQAGTITVLVLAWTSTLLRFTARRLRRVSLGVDDYLLIASLVSEWQTANRNILTISWYGPYFVVYRGLRSPVSSDV